jgi:circadian clock protein KaiB
VLLAGNFEVLSTFSGEVRLCWSYAQLPASATNKSSEDWIFDTQDKGMPVMAKKTVGLDSVAGFEKAVRTAQEQRYVLRLYVAGINRKSLAAIRSIKEICESHLHGRYDLEVIDLYQQPNLAKGEQIIAAPTLIKKLPLPLRRFIGDLADKDRILVGLDLKHWK